MRRRVLGLLAPAALVLSGCQAPTDLSEDAARELQAAVLELHRAAAEERYDAAGTAAGEVRAALDTAAESGGVSVARYRQIDAALTAAEEELAVVSEGPERTATTPTAGPVVVDGSTQQGAPADTSPRAGEGTTGSTGREGAPGRQKAPPGQEQGPGKGP